MIETIERLCRLLETSTVSIAEVGTGLGKVVGGSDDAPLAVKPSDPTIVEALVVREPGTDDPAYVDLVPSEGNAPPIADLEAAFGNFTRVPRVHWNNPNRIIFYPPSPGTSHTCAIIAEVRPGEGGLEDGQVTRLTVRRDRRLD